MSFNGYKQCSPEPGYVQSIRMLASIILVRMYKVATVNHALEGYHPDAIILEADRRITWAIVIETDEK
jgi:hypothetical protein